MAGSSTLSKRRNSDEIRTERAKHKEQGKIWNTTILEVDAKLWRVFLRKWGEVKDQRDERRKGK